MPKQTFFNLPTEKQKTLIESAKKEFSRVPLNDASISNIVKDAEIPRGSFYQYFTDKEDAFYYLLEQEMEVHSAHFLITLQKNKGDLFVSFIDVFENMLIELEHKDNRDFFRNTFLNMNYKIERIFTSSFSNEKLDEQYTEFINSVNMDILNIDDPCELIHVLQILTTITIYNLMHVSANKTPFGEALENFTFEINLLKSGLYKK